MPNTIATLYGTVTVHVAITSEPGIAPYVTITGTTDELHSWSHRIGGAWPCSDLALCIDDVHARFHPNGDLVDIDHPGMDDIDGHELAAWTTDVLQAAGLRHPAARKGS